VDDIVATGFEAQGNGPVDVSASPILVTGDATLNAVSDVSVSLGDVTLTNGATLTVAGTADPITISDATIASGETAVGFNTSADTALSGNGLEGSAAAATITKAGAKNLILDKAGSNLGSATFDVQAGSLVAVHSNAFGGATLSLNAGELLLSSPTGDITYVEAIVVVTNSTLTVGQAGDGVVGPLTNTVRGDITFSGSNTLTTLATDDYTLRLGGQIVGNGILDLTGG
ncbi:MAG: hypothetical protein ACKVH7_13085, partial [Alphaproteobacteria bacterium]